MELGAQGSMGVLPGRVFPASTVDNESELSCEDGLLMVGPLLA